MSRAAVQASTPASPTAPAAPVAEASGPTKVSSPDAAQSWTVHGVRERPLAAVLGALVIGAFGAAAAGFMGAAGWAGPVMIFMVLACRDFYLPVHARVDRDGVERRTLLGRRSIPRSHMRSIESRPGSWRISVRGVARRFDPRAIVLPKPVDPELRRRVTEALGRPAADDRKDAS